MNHRTIVIYLTALILFTINGRGQSIPDYHSRYNFLMAPSGTFEEGLVGFANPANVGMLHDFESRFYWNTDGTDATSFNDWGVFGGFKALSFGALRQHFDDTTVTDYRFSSGFGSDGFALGFGYGWSTGDPDDQGRENLITVGSLCRPLPYLSVGLIGNFSTQSNAREGVAEIGIRPFGTPRFTLFADAALQKKMQLSDAPWSAGAAIQVVPGIYLTGRMFDTQAFTAGLTINFGHGGVASQLHFDSDQNHAGNTYMIRSGGMKPSIFPTLIDKGRRYLPMELKGEIAYQKYMFFDEETHKLIDILRNIQMGAEDPRVSAIVLNLSSMNVVPENAWEIRQELKNARQSGKRVFIFIDNAGMTTYHLASVADQIIMDPEGTIMLPGYLMGRTFYKGTLEKLGLGFEEWRFFKYKSAAEGLSRKEMSEPDREQRQAYVDDWYELMRADVCEERPITPDEFDALIDERVIFLPDSALAAGLVDTLARWSAKDEVIASLTGKALRGISADNLLGNALPPRKWGSRPEIAVVYGLGVCALDEGIKARWLEKVFLRLAGDKSVKAVVFRVDSPGGDGMASDLVAQALKKCSEKKPVVVSQGQVAGSGGYWISMYGDEIVAGPSTITGSIGVIGGWLYDKGFSDKVGMTSDFVKRGEHADLGFGIGLPLADVHLPARNLTPDEMERVEKIIKEFYDSFVKKVAEGRGMAEEEVRKIAEGHFYSGLDGQQVGLVDEIGNLITAIAIAREQAGIAPEAEVILKEIPENKGLFKLGPTGAPASAEMKNEPVLQYIRMFSKHPMKPLPMLLPGTYPTLD